EQHTGEQRRPSADRVAHEALHEHPGEQRTAYGAHDHPQAAEEVERPAGVGGEKLHGDEVEEAPPEAGPAELRLAVPPGLMVDVDLTHLEAPPLREHGDVPVQLAVQLERRG